MDTRTRSASPVAPVDVKMEQSPPLQDKISAYYSLVFPHFTFYIQTLSVTIGRRCAPNPHAATSSTAEQPSVDVDLGALKSVSRLHAKIEYDQDEDRFILAVIGRNGAWVDGVWCGSGTRAPLGERSQIQIASRTFHFILPPPLPAEDTPSPSSQSSANRPRSPSVDITSISPPSSQHSHSPPPPAERKLPAPLPEPQLPPSPTPQRKPHSTPLSHPQLPNSNLIGKPNKATSSKKRKKSDVEPTVLPKPKPEDMPPKPPFTYAQLIYRAIKAIGEKATLQEICSWIMNTHDYYRYTDASWMSSVRHNLSSSRAFLKLERCGGDRGKGFFWKLDEKHSQALEEQEAKNWKNGSAAQGGTEGTGKRKKDKALSMLEPPLKRSVKGEPKGTPLPPPLTSTPLPPTTTLATTSVNSSISSTPTLPSIKDTVTTPAAAATGVFAYPHHAQMKPMQQPSMPTSVYSAQPLSAPNPYTAWTLHPMTTPNETATTFSTAPSANLTPTTNSQQPSAAPVSDVSLPIVLGPIPPTHPDYSPSHPHNSAKEGYMILHERTLILDPDVFGGLTKESLSGLEKMGTIAALQVLKDHMVKALKERRAKGRGRGGKRMRGSGKRGSGAGMIPTGGPFTNVPLEKRPTSGVPASGDTATTEEAPLAEATADTVGSCHPAGTAALLLASESVDVGGQAKADSPFVIVDDSGDEGPLPKRRKVDNGPS